MLDADELEGATGSEGVGFEAFCLALKKLRFSVGVLAEVEFELEGIEVEAVGVALLAIPAMLKDVPLDENCLTLST